MNKSKMLTIAAASLMMCACGEKDYYDPNWRTDAYSTAYHNEFGEVSPEQDWNMATRATVAIDLTQEGVLDGTVQVMDQDPAQGSASLLATTTLNGGCAAIDCDVIKGTPVLYVRVRDQYGRTQYASYTRLDNGVAPVGAKASGSVATRAASDVSLGEKYVFQGQASSESRVWDESYTLNDAKAVGDTEFLAYKGTETETTHIVVNEWYEYDDTKTYYIFEDIYGNIYKVTSEWNIEGETGFKYNSLHNPQRLVKVVGTPDQTYQRLNGVETAHVKSWSVNEYMHIFGKGGYFEEQRNPSCLEKWKEQFEPNISYTIGGPLTLDYMFGGTEHDNVFGYYYWQDGEDPVAATRYVLIADAQPSSNLTYVTPDGETQWVVDDETTWSGHTEFVPSGTYTDHGAVGDMALATWMVQDENAGAIVTGTSYKVPYIAPDGTMSYDFPEGTHIAFFLVVNGLTIGMDQWLANTNLSMRDHNLQALNRTFSGYSRDNTDPDDTQGEIDAITFKYKNQIFLGFEDRGGDKDMNDIVFFVNGKAEIDIKSEDKPEDKIIDIEPDPEPDPEEPEVEPQPQSWIIACEDLGGTYDFDFNDVVFSVSHVAGSTTAVITPLAAGGTMPAFITYNGVSKGEIHGMLGSTSTKVMINTEAYGNKGLTATGAPIEILVPADFTVTDKMGGLGVLVKNSNANSEAEDTYAIEAPGKGAVPEMILVPGTWLWPTERTRIHYAYPSFGAWGQNYGNQTWYQSYDPNGVVRR